MSIFSDYKCGALSEVDFHNACVEMNRLDRWEREHIYDYYDDESDDLIVDLDGEGEE